MRDDNTPDDTRPAPRSDFRDTPAGHPLETPPVAGAQRAGGGGPKAQPLARVLASALVRVRDDREHGASYLARVAAEALAQAAAAGLADSRASASASAHAIRRTAGALAVARPSMAILTTSVAHICAAAWPAGAPGPGGNAGDDVAARKALERVISAATQLVAGWDTTAEAIARHARPLVRGVVATVSRSATVEYALRALCQRPAAIAAIVVAESRPGGEGIALARALAGALGEAGPPITVVADAALGAAVTAAACVVTGADSVRADGSVVNKVGTYHAALAAHAAGIPCYVLCESLKIAPDGWALTLEEMDPAELLPTPPPGVSARNLYFDRTPAEYITAVVTERGPLAASAVADLAREHARELALLTRNAAPI